MSGQNSIRSFLRTTLIVAAIAGVTAGVVLATNETVRAWHADGMALGDIAYAVAAAAMLMFAGVVLLASTNARKVPVLPLAIVAVVLGIGLGRISSHLAGTPEGLTGAGAYFFDGLGVGMLVVYWMTRRAGRSAHK
ncbi:MAG: hypothetical protein WCA81_08605 [Rhizomicrobium sp.]